MAEIIDIPIGGLSNDLYNETIKKAYDNRIIILNQEVDDSLVEDIVMHIFMWNIEDYGLPADKRKNIIIVINSVGGDVFTALNVVDSIKQSVTPVRVVAMGLVASSAYYIYLSAHERIAFKNSAFLQHDGSLMVANSGTKAKQTMAFYENMDDRIKHFVLENSNMTEEFYDKNYENELYLYADQAKELGIVDKIIGEDISLDQVFCE